VELLHRLHHLLMTKDGLLELIGVGGLLVLVVIVFAETGLLVGFFLPGDSLLFTAGFLCSHPDSPLRIGTTILALSLAAIAGDATGYWLGRAAGHALYERKESRFFRRAHLIKTRDFYERHGPVTIVLARFVPFARTFAPVVAGIGKMRYARFAAYNVIGGAGWITSMSLAGYWLGRIPWVERHFEQVVLGIIFVSVLPVAIPVAKAWWQSRGRARTS
jgi:membrane-associated protein